MAKNSHMTLDMRLEIETGLKEGLSFAEIGRIIGKDPSTVSKEVRNHYIVKDTERYQPCRHRNSCKHERDVCRVCTRRFTQLCSKCKDVCCSKTCPEYEEEVCPRHGKPPYVCNGCDRRLRCTLRRHVYEAKAAQKEYESTLSESRKGIETPKEELNRLDDLISPLVKQGQSIHHICIAHAAEIMLDEKTIYNYVDAGLLSVGNLDLPRKVRYRTRKRKKTVRVDKKCHVGRTYEDYQRYMEEHPDTAVVEMDSVEGIQGGKVLLTILFKSCDFMLAFLRDCNTARSVTDIFNNLYELLGHDVFQELFPLVLADRGSEFTDPMSIECDMNTGEVRTRMFYCDPQRSNQKGSCEVTHEMIRRVIPKGKPLDAFTQADIDCMMSHINSYTRKKLNNRSAHQLFSMFHGEDVLRKLNQQSIPADDINLTPALLKK